MTHAPSFLTVEQVLIIHQRMIAEFGGEPGIRDRGLLESAVMMPAAGFGGEFLHAGLLTMAAAYLFHLCRNHPFVDGNKRTALAASEVFLLLNDIQLNAANAELEALTMDVPAGRSSKQDVVDFYRKHAELNP